MNQNCTTLFDLLDGNSGYIALVVNRIVFDMFLEIAKITNTTAMPVEFILMI